MTSKYKNGEIWGFEKEGFANGGSELDDDKDSVILGLDGGATSTVCVCLPLFRTVPDADLPLPILARAVAGCSNHNSVGANGTLLFPPILGERMKLLSSLHMPPSPTPPANTRSLQPIPRKSTLGTSEAAARDTLEQVIAETLLKSGSKRSAVRAVCLGVSGVNHPKDQERILKWLRDIFPSHVKLLVHSDAVAALASGTFGKLHGCVLIAGTGCISYGFAEDGREAHASGAGPILGDWGSGYGIAAQALTAVMRAHDGRGPQTALTGSILQKLGLPSPDELIGWTYADPSWARIAALAPVVVSCAEGGDHIANKILNDAVQELALSVKAVVERLCLAGADGTGSFPIVMVGGVLEANKKRDIRKEVIDCIQETYPKACPIRPKVEPAVGAALLSWHVLMKE